MNTKRVTYHHLVCAVVALGLVVIVAVGEIGQKRSRNCTLAQSLPVKRTEPLVLHEVRDATCQKGKDEPKSYREEKKSWHQ